jgi:general secretion pathway protein C
MLARSWTFGVWALVAASALFWGLKVFVKAPQAPRETVVAQPGSGARGDLSRLFGVDAPAPMVQAEAAPVVDTRFKLIGVVSPRGSQAAAEGLALIAIDDKPAKAYRVGAVVDGDNVLQRVSARGVSLGPRGGPGRVALEMPPLAAAATGTLPDIGGQAQPMGRATAPPGVPRVSGPGMPGWRPPGSSGRPGDRPADNGPQLQGNQAAEGTQTR